MNQDQDKKSFRQFMFKFCLALFIACIGLSIFVPPFQSPDEFAHIKRAYLFGEGTVLLETPEGKESGGSIDKGFLQYMDLFQGIPFHSERQLTLTELSNAHKLNWTDSKEFSEEPGAGFYFPIIYLPHSLGIKLGKLIGGGPDTSYRLARILATAASLLIVLWAFTLFTPTLYICTLLSIPMMLFQLMSASLDGITTSVAILAISIFLKLTNEKEKSKTWLLYVLSLAVLLLGTSRLHLAPLVLLIFGAFKFTKRKRSLFLGLAVSMLIVSWTLFALKTVVVKRVVVGASFGEIFNFHFAWPMDFIVLLARTIIARAHFYTESFLGILGWLDLEFPKPVYLVLLILLAIAFAKSYKFKKIKLQYYSGILLTSCISSILLIFLSLLFGHSKHPANLIDGVQGRYFFGPALLLGYALPIKGDLQNYWAQQSVRNFLMGFLSFSVFVTLIAVVCRYLVI